MSVSVCLSLSLSVSVSLCLSLSLSVSLSLSLIYWSDVLLLYLMMILLYSATLRSRADSLRSHVILHEWLAFYSAFLNIHRSSVLMAGATWNCCRLGAFCVHYTTMYHVTSCKAGCMLIICKWMMHGMCSSGAVNALFMWKFSFITFHSLIQTYTYNK